MSHLPELDNIQTRINNYLSEKLNQLPINDETLLSAMRYGLLIGGKRMRPYLAYITGECLGANVQDIDGVAAALECIHAFVIT